MGRIIVIEDTLSHIDDARQYFGSLEEVESEEVEVEYAQTYYEAAEKMFGRDYNSWDKARDAYNKALRNTPRESWDSIPKPPNRAERLAKEGLIGVISDIYFSLQGPVKIGDRLVDPEPQPIGVRVAVELSQLGVPFVLNTAGYHHGMKYSWINGMAREQGWTLIDASDDHFKDAETKDWGLAYRSLQAVVAGTDIPHM
jgi:hypothetical protein